MKPPKNGQEHGYSQKLQLAKSEEGSIGNCRNLVIGNVSMEHTHSHSHVHARTHTHTHTQLHWAHITLHTLTAPPAALDPHDPRTTLHTHSQLHQLHWTSKYQQIDSRDPIVVQVPDGMECGQVSTPHTKQQ